MYKFFVQLKDGTIKCHLANSARELADSIYKNTTGINIMTERAYIARLEEGRL